MKGTGLRKVAAAALAGTMALSLASCMLFGPNKKEIVEAADNFASTLLKQDAGKIVKLTTEKKDSDAAEALEMLFDSSWYSDDQNAFIKAVSDTISYEVDEESVEVDKEDASVDVVFTMVDYEKALKGEDFSDIDEVKDAIKDCDDTKDVTVTFEFEKDDDEWLLSNLDDKDFSKLFDFYTYELNLKPDLTSIIDYTDSYGGSYYLDLYIYTTEDVTEYDGDITFDVYYEGSMIASGVTAYVYSYYICCDYYDPDYNYLASGTYSIAVNYGDVEIAYEDIVVDNSYYETTASTFSGDLASEVYYTDWWWDNDDNTYDVGVEEIEFDVYFNVDVSGYDMTFDVKDGDGNTIDSYVTVQNNGYSVYCIWEPGGEIPAGVYAIGLFDGDTADANFIISDYCEIK